MDDNKLTIAEWHRKQAVECFNSCWDYIEKKDRTAEDDMKMIHLAHASRYHWGEIGTALQFARGEWQISRVYALLGRFESALYHAKNNLELCQSHNIGDFDLAFAYEANARAYLIGKEVNLANSFLKLAEDAAENIAKDADKEYFLSELAQLKINAFEEGFPDGIYTEPQPSDPKLKVKAMYEYCDKKGITPEELSEEEMQQFLNKSV
ncbi:hypothetical protein ACFFJY_00500 [Fictibacillus aquaticus]|uniref:hypothetical protein n=1 Tax=Fictibacillus aquaticus TaxID=2021314 RepID=UPI00197A795B|nr:hypothetical protein [Fictibacillus aquaticus]